MACGEKVETTESYWTWCKKRVWGVNIPYPCKKRRTVIKYRYDFLPWRSLVTWPFRCKYEGCCGTSLYRWSHWCWRGTGNSAWNKFSPRTRYFDSIQTPIGNCPFKDEGVVID